MFEWLHKKITATAEYGNSTAEAAPGAQVYRIEFEKMLKGALVMRRGKPIRQCGVTMDGSTRLVTSGDVVDRDTYEALMAAGVLAGGPVDRSRKGSPADAADSIRPNAEAS